MTRLISYILKLLAILLNFIVMLIIENLYIRRNIFRTIQNISGKML